MNTPRKPVTPSPERMVQSSISIVPGATEYYDDFGNRFVMFGQEITDNPASVNNILTYSSDLPLLQKLDEDGLFKLPVNAVSVEAMANDNRYTADHPAVSDVWSLIGRTFALLPEDYYTSNARLEQLLVDKENGKVLLLPTLEIVRVSTDKQEGHFHDETQTLADNAIPQPRNPRSSEKHADILRRLRAAVVERST